MRADIFVCGVLWFVAKSVSVALQIPARPLAAHYDVRVTPTIVRFAGKLAADFTLYLAVISTGALSSWLNVSSSSCGTSYFISLSAKCTGITTFGST